MNGEEDLYSFLGVLPDAESIVITAAYRALASRYHPDRWNGPSSVAHARMAEINRAYDVLGNPEKRSAYDSKRNASAHTFQDTSQDQSQAFDDALDQLEDRWKVATGIFPNLIDIRQRLTRTSRQLSFAFVTLLLERREFNQADHIAMEMERRFLERYFGTDERILAFVKELVKLGLRDAVKALNRLVDVLGPEVEPSLLIDKISKEFDVCTHRRVHQAAIDGEVSARVEQERNTEKARAEESRLRTRTVRIAVLRERMRSQPAFWSLKELLELLGYRLVQIRQGLFVSPVYEVQTEGEVVVRRGTRAEVTRWASTAPPAP